MPFRSMLLVAVASLLLVTPAILARAHDPSPSDWPSTYRSLVELFPDAEPTRWRCVRARLDDGQARRLGLETDRAVDAVTRERTFFVAYATDGALLGVATFVRADGAPRLGPIGVGVDTWGRVTGVTPARSLDAEPRHVGAAEREALLVMRLLLGRDDSP